MRCSIRLQNQTATRIHWDFIYPSFETETEVELLPAVPQIRGIIELAYIIPCLTPVVNIDPFGLRKNSSRPFSHLALGEVDPIISILDACIGAVEYESIGL